MFQSKENLDPQQQIAFSFRLAHGHRVAAKSYMATTETIAKAGSNLVKLMQPASAAAAAAAAPSVVAVTWPTAATVAASAPAATLAVVAATSPTDTATAIATTKLTKRRKVVTAMSTSFQTKSGRCVHNVDKFAEYR
jgi:hypothetical protein